MEEQDRHREQIYLYPSINKRSQVNHTFVLKLEHSTQHVLKKARKFLQTGTAAPSAGSAHPLPGARRGSRHRHAAAGREPNTARLLQARRLTPTVWSWAGGHGISGAKRSPLHFRRPAEAVCFFTATKIWFQFRYPVCFPGQEPSPLLQEKRRGRAGRSTLALAPWMRAWFVGLSPSASRGKMSSTQGC